MVPARVIQIGRNQAIQLSKNFRVNGKKVYLKKTPNGVLLVIERDPWELFSEGAAELSSQFMAKGRRQAGAKDEGGKIIGCISR
jgi:virulence-associated protein VagC